MLAGKAARNFAARVVRFLELPGKLQRRRLPLQRLLDERRGLLLVDDGEIGIGGLGELFRLLLRIAHFEKNLSPAGFRCRIFVGGNLLHALGRAAELSIACFSASATAAALFGVRRAGLCAGQPEQRLDRRAARDRRGAAGREAHPETVGAGRASSPAAAVRLSTAPGRDISGETRQTSPASRRSVFSSYSRMPR